MQTNIIKIITFSHLDIYQWKRLHAALSRPQVFSFTKFFYFDGHYFGNKPTILVYIGLFSMAKVKNQDVVRDFLVFR